MKTEWIELGKVQLRDEVVVFRQTATVVQIDQIGEAVTLTAETEDGHKLVYSDYADTAIRKVVQDAE